MHVGRVTGSQFVNSESFLPVHRNIARQLPNSLRFVFGSFLFSARSAGALDQHMHNLLYDNITWSLARVPRPESKTFTQLSQGQKCGSTCPQLA